MFIAMNRFRIALGAEETFEKLWRERDSHLDDVPGFREFHLLRGPLRRGSHALRLPHDLGDARGIRGMDRVGELSQGAPGSARAGRAPTSAIRASKASR